LGILKTRGTEKQDSLLRSVQSVDLKNSKVRNVVTLQLPGDNKASIFVDVGFRPDQSDGRRVNVKFQACRIKVSGSPIDVTFPLGIIGPTGWLRTGYIDENIRITRGHKGSVFILCRSGSFRQDKSKN